MDHDVWQLLVEEISKNVFASIRIEQMKPYRESLNIWDKLDRITGTRAEIEYTVGHVLIVMDKMGLLK